MERCDDERSPLVPHSASFTFVERLRDSIRRHRLNSVYVGFCVMITLMCLGLVAYSLFFLRDKGELARYPNALWFLLAEALITLIIFVETGADMVVYGCKEYWQNPWHVLDFIICVVCLASLVVDVIFWANVIQISEYFGVFLLILRYVAQGTRVMRLLRNAQKAKAERDAVDATFVVMPAAGVSTSSAALLSV